MKDKVLAFAKEHGYEGVTLGKVWNGYQVYEPVFDKNEIAYVGYPLVIFVNEKEIRMSTAEESIEYLHFSSRIDDNISKIKTAKSSIALRGNTFPQANIKNPRK